MLRRSNAFGSWLFGVARSALAYIPALFRKAGPVVLVCAALLLGLAAVTGIASDLLLAAKDHATALRIGGTVAIAEAEAELVEAEARNIRADAAVSQSEALAAQGRIADELAQARERAALAPVDFSNTMIAQSRKRPVSELLMRELLLTPDKLGPFAPYVDASRASDFVNRFNSIMTNTAGDDGILSRSEANSLVRDGTDQTPLLGALLDDFKVEPDYKRGRAKVINAALGLTRLGIGFSE